MENKLSSIDTGKTSNAYPSLIFPGKSLAMNMIRHNNYTIPVQSYPVSPHVYFANIAKYTEAATEIKTSAASNDLLCAVCGDVSSGKHYGILACNGCSGFFKRTVRRKLIYHCQINSDMCAIDKAHRNQCQACRFKKCLQMGMIKEAVQNERPPRNNTRIDLHTGRKISVLYPRSSEQTNLISDSSLKRKQTEYAFVNHLDDTTAAQILLMIIKWIRNLPTFLNLPIHDQRILLEETWAELFLLWAIQYSISMNNDGSLFSRECQIRDVFNVFKNLKVDSMEFVCLKAIVLFRFDIRILKEVKVIENLQDQAQMTLAQFTQVQNPTRFGRLLLTLPLLRSIPSIFIEKTYFPHISISKLLVDMFKN